MWLRSEEDGSLQIEMEITKPCLIDNRSFIKTSNGIKNDSIYQQVKISSQLQHI